MSKDQSDAVARRRRGAALEKAILGAAWDELEEAGYNAFTFEGVAQRAQTSRPVLYRRWPTRMDLAFAAMQHHLERNPVDVPDMGDVRSELLALLRKFADRSPPRLARLVFDMGEDMQQQSAGFSDLRENPMAKLFERAIMRGEIDPGKLASRIARLPTSLVFHEIVITQQRVTDEAIQEIVDNIFLPLVTPDTPTR